MKGSSVDDPYTDADLKVQALTILSLRHVWPDIKIVGEEEENFDKEFDIDYKSFKRDLVPKDLFKNFSTEIPLDKCIVWVDPLDGTQDFVNGSLDCVTTLIGISVENKAKVGIIGKYFTKKGEKEYEWTPKCYFSHADYPHVYYMDYLQNSKIEELKGVIPSDPNRFWVGTTMHHMDDTVKKGIEKITPEKLCRIGGCGNKILHTIEGQIDCYFYPKTGCKRWDICPGEAILKSLGGYLTDSEGNEYTYVEDRDQAYCSKGVIASLRKEVHTKVIDRLNTK